MRRSMLERAELPDIDTYEPSVKEAEVMAKYGHAFQKQRCVLCSCEGPLKLDERGARICEDPQACIARLTEAIRVR